MCGYSSRRGNAATPANGELRRSWREWRVLTGYPRGQASCLPDAWYRPGGGNGDRLATVGFRGRLGDQVACGLVDHGRAQEEGGVANLELAQCLLDPAGNRSADARSESGLLMLLRSRLVPRGK
jgi:hypothetical protein